MQFAIDTAAGIPIYQQLTDQICAGIARGKLRPDERLPSVRELSQTLGRESQHRGPCLHRIGARRRAVHASWHGRVRRRSPSARLQRKSAASDFPAHSIACSSKPSVLVLPPTNYSISSLTVPSNINGSQLLPPQAEPIPTRSPPTPDP